VRHQQAAAAVLDQLFGPADRRGDDRDASGHRLQHSQRGALVERWEGEDVAGGEQLRHVRAAAEEADPLGDA
jgi:hypothetical protein